MILTSGGPPRKIVPCCFTMILSSAIAGTYAPPAVQLPRTTAICNRKIVTVNILFYIKCDEPAIYFS